ncbi:MAG: isopenicillin N synthase family oxygenase [Sphingomonadaceae bacterium]|nr:isopenicillin N synthase family oxygenase [Sphingomonadaceae bacterium]
MGNISIPVLDLEETPDHFAAQIADSFRRFGFAMVRNHGISPDMIERGWKLTAEFFALPDKDKMAYLTPGQGGARGYTPFGTEMAKGAKASDLKEFWHVGRDLEPLHPLEDKMPANVWPERPPEFRDVFSRLFAEFDRVGGVLLERIAIDLGLRADWFNAATEDGNSVMRLAHYPPVAGHPGQALRAGPHEDINLITLLLGAEEAGLELLGTDGHWHGVNPPDGAMVVNIGDMLQRLTNHVLPSTTHRVNNPQGNRSGTSRYSMPFFVHLRSDFQIRTLPQCISAGVPDQYPEPITADGYLQERLKEIGLLE